MFFDSLGQLYNLLSKEEKTYSEAVSSINDIAELIGREIESIVLDNDSVAVAGMSYDKDGIAEGYDYDETYVEHVSNMGVRIHLFIVPIPKRRRKNCFPKFVPGRCEYCLAVRRKWEPVRMFRTDW